MAKIKIIREKKPVDYAFTKDTLHLVDVNPTNTESNYDPVEKSNSKIDQDYRLRAKMSS